MSAREERIDKLLSRRVAPVFERERIKRDIDLAKKDDSGESPELNREQRKFVSQNPDTFNRNCNKRAINRMERVLANSQPQPLTNEETKILEDEEKLLTEKVKSMMVPRSQVTLREFDGSNRNTEYSKAVNHMAKVEFSREYTNLAHRLKNIRKTLRPEDPDAGNLEFIRPD